MKKLNYLLLLCMMAISTWSYAQCTGSGGILVNQGGDTLCPGDTTKVLLATASAPSMGDVSGFSWVISNADISGSNDPLNSATYVAGLPVTATATVQLMEVFSDYVSAPGTYYLTSVAFGNGTWTGADMDDIGDVTLDPACTFSSSSLALEFNGTTCPPDNNACAGAIDLSSSLGQAVDTPVTTGPYDNTYATAGTDDLLDVSCFGENNSAFGAPAIVNNTLWFKITGDGSLYNIIASSNECASTSNPIAENDTQIAVYTGGCGGLNLVTCNEDYSNNAPAGDYYSEVEINTQTGTDYYIMVDGFDCSGAACGGIVSTGEYCMTITKKPSVACSDSGVSGGTASVTDNIICEGELTSIDVTGALAPTEGILSGYAWAVSSGDLQGNVDFSNDPTFIGGFPVGNAPANPLVFDHSGSGATSATGNYFYTLVAFGNAEWGPNGTQFLTQAVLDSACTFLSNSVEMEYYETAFCPDSMVNVLDVDKEILSMTVFPNPVQDVMNLNINSNDYVTATVLINTITGQAVREEQITLVRGFNTFSINMSDAATGIYMVSIASDTHQSVTRFLKQ